MSADPEVSEAQVLETINEWLDSTAERIERLQKAEANLARRRAEIEGVGYNPPPVSFEWRRGFDKETAPLAGSLFDNPVPKEEFITTLVVDCGLTLGEAHSALRTAVERRFWVERGDSLYENGNVNPAGGPPPDLSCCGVDYHSPREFFDHVDEAHPLEG